MVFASCLMFRMFQILRSGGARPAIFSKCVKYIEIAGRAPTPQNLKHFWTIYLCHMLDITLESLSSLHMLLQPLPNLSLL